ncbi:MAG: crossover junction endodeoxyribonuclease RuvC [Sphaerobacteraceae bacterium]|nr:MAG: crossover junction endodeoxyribonuclease RuvC [Sphaerobacteraceae bacterium]
MTPDRVTLGIDPGTARLGYGVIRGSDPASSLEFGIVETTSSQDMPARLLQLHDELIGLIREYRPAVMVIEKLFFSRNVTNAISVGQARGVAMLTAAESGISVVEYTPAEVKQAVAGYGNADKKQIQEMVKLILGLEEIPEPDDAADALAVAICHVQHAGFLESVEGGTS